MKRLQKLTNKCPLKTFFIGSLTAATVLHLFEKRYIIGTLISFVLARILRNSLNSAIVAAEKVSAGDLTNQIEVNSNDEIGKLLAAFQLMTGNLNSLIRQVQQSGIQITTSTTQIAASGKELEAVVTQQVASTNQVVATAQEIASNSEQLVKTMEEVTNLSQSTAIATSGGQKDLIQMQATMRQLAEATRSISSKLGVIRDKANSINSIVTTITKVADQTNLLSLNAAIEAEKAGEYGLGFSVVAREIRRLADQTAIATLDIESMVKEMQSAVSTGVMEMDKFSKEVTRSVENVGNISLQLGEVIQQVQSLTPRFEIVSQGMETQSQGAQQISESMLQLREASLQTAEALRETNTALEQLNDAAQNLRGETSRFKVNN
jgi:methyl-accepting chemotaxis protein WspA